MYIYPGEKTGRIKLYPESKCFYDFGRCMGGDCVRLWSHVRGCDSWQALKEIREAFGLNTPDKANSWKLIRQQEQARRQQIEKAYDLALQRLLSLEEGDYCALLVKLCQETGEKQGEILLNARDKARLGETLVEQINQKIGAAFTLGQEEKNIAGGFVLRQGPVEINCALETAVHLLEEETASQVAAILF